MKLHQISHLSVFIAILFFSPVAAFETNQQDLWSMGFLGGPNGISEPGDPVYLDASEERTIRVTGTPNGPFKIRIVRIGDDSCTDYVQEADGTTDIPYVAPGHTTVEVIELIVGGQVVQSIPVYVTAPVFGSPDGSPSGGGPDQSDG